MSSKSKKPFRLLAIPLFFILIIWMTTPIAGCGSAAEGTDTTAAFKASLNPPANQAVAALTTISQTESSCRDDIVQSFPDGIINSSVMPLQSNGNDKKQQLSSCGPKLTQAKAALDAAMTGLQAVVSPPGCDSCKNALDTLNTAVNDAEKNLPQSIDLINFDASILAVSNDEINRLMAIPNLGDYVTEQDLKNYYGSQAAAYDACIAKWKSFNEPAYADKIQAVIAAKQTQADLANQEAGGSSSITEVQMAMGQKEEAALTSANNAALSVFQAVRDKLRDLDNSFDQDKASADRVVSNISPSGNTTGN